MFTVLGWFSSFSTGGGFGLLDICNSVSFLQDESTTLSTLD